MINRDRGESDLLAAAEIGSVLVFLLSSEGLITPDCSHPVGKEPTGRTATQGGNHICFPTRVDAKGKASHLERVQLQWTPKKDAPSQSPGNPVAAPKTALAHCSEDSGTEQSAAWKLGASRYYPLCRNKRGDLEMRSQLDLKDLLKGKDGEPGEPTSAWEAPSICPCLHRLYYQSSPSCSHGRAHSSGMGGSWLWAHPQAGPFPLKRDTATGRTQNLPSTKLST